MEYIVGVALGLVVCGLATFAGFERDRSFYPVVMIVISSYYGLFAVVGGDSHALGIELIISVVFVSLALIGFKSNLWIVAATILGHACFDLVHTRVVTNAGVPSYWPMFCASIDAFMGVYLCWRLLARRIEATNRLSFGNRIRPYVDIELAASQAAKRRGDPSTEFRHLERAHVLSQRSTVQHVRVHVRMLAWGLRQHELREVIGQLTRIVGAATGTWAGLAPRGNTGGANVSALEPMPIPDDLSDLIDVACLPREWRV